MGNLFYRKVSPFEIEAMPYHKLKYWNEWHLIMEKEEVDAADRIRRAGQK